MFKKLTSFFVIAILSLCLIACGGNSDTSTSSMYKDGTYTASADPWQFGSEDATVVIKDGKITEVTLRRLDSNDKEVNYDDWQGQTVDGKTYPNLKQYRVDMAEAIINNQNTNVEAISGATVSTNNWKVAVDRALEKAKM